jgi:GT2 family glycosyltransferase
LRELAFPKERLEVIVVDNASTDGSVEMLRTKFPEVRVLQNQVNVGFSRAVNQAVAASSGEYTAFLNNDIRVDPNWLNALLEPLQKTPAIACAGSLILTWDGLAVDYFGRPDDLFSLKVPVDPPPTPVPASDACVRAMFTSGGAMLIRRGLFEDLGGFDPGYFMYHEDVDLGWRLWLQGHEVVLCPRSVVYHKGSASSARLPEELAARMPLRNMLATFFKNLDETNLHSILPLLLYYLLERGRLWEPARAPLSLAVAHFADSLEELIRQRNQIQATRRLTDADLFSRVPHPLAFLLEQPSYQTIHRSVLESSRQLAFDAQNAESVRRCLAEWLNAAHFIFEERLIGEIHEIQSSEIPALAASVDRNQTALQALSEKHSRLEDALKAVSTQADERQQALEAASAQLAERQQALQAISAESVEKDIRINELTAALRAFQESRSWKTAQLLARVYTWFRPRRPGAGGR